MSDDLKGILFAGLAALMWGVLAIALKVALGDVPPASVVWFRFLVAFLIMFLYLVSFNRKSLRLFIKPPLKLIITALLLGLNYFGFIYGLSFTTPGNAQLFIQTGPLALAFAGIVIFRERVTLRQIFGFMLVTAGFILFYFRQIEAVMGSHALYNKGIFWIITGGLSWAGFSVFQKQLVQNHSAAALNTFIFGLCTIVFLPAVKYNVFTHLSTGNIVLLIFLGINTVIAYGALAMALKFTEAKKISIIVTLNPLITFSTMGILAGLQVSWITPEHLDSLSILGAVLVIAGAVMVILKKQPGKQKLPVDVISRSSH
ncbi:MAG: DMT family transporter [Chlorobi bacterium]|nr:DMT family transporter [Chlorobiota bacterium]